MTGGVGRGRSVAAVALIVIGAVLLPLGVLGTWAQRTLLDTESYVATVAPLSDDPAVQQSVATQVTEGLLAAARTNALLSSLLAPGGAVGDAVTHEVEQLVLRAVRSPQFAPVWADVNRALQVNLLAALRGEPTDTVRIDGERLLVDTEVMLAAVQDRLAESLPAIGAVDLSAFGQEVVVADSPALRRAGAYVTWVDSFSPWLLPLAVVALVVGVLLARHRPRALVVVGVLVVCGAGVVAVATATGERLVDDALSTSVLQPAASAVLHALSSDAQGWVRLLLWCGLVSVAVGGAWWVVRSRSAQPT